jgi:hypothetical protein
MYCFPIGN